MVHVRDGPQHPGMTQKKAGPRGRWPFNLVGAFAACLLALIVVVAISEALGWPYLVGPMQKYVAKALDRRVLFAPDANTPAHVRIGLIGSVRLDAAYLELGAPAWSSAPHMLLARDARLRLGYFDLWRAYQGKTLHIRELEASSLDGRMERTADGRASWQFGSKPKSAAPDEPLKPPTFGILQIGQGSITYRDAPLAVTAEARFSLLEQRGLSGPVDPQAPASAAASASGVAGAVPKGLQLHGTGTYQKLPFRIDVETTGVLPIVSEEARRTALPVSLEAVVGRARMSFKGTATDALHLTDLKGTFSVQGPSLASLGDPLKVTLPTTGAFAADGLVAKTGLVWNAVVKKMSVGSSRLDGAFTYDPRPATPLLSGRLGASRLALVDLGPAVGAPAKDAADKSGDKQSADAKAVTKKAEKVLPDRRFDLPSLRAMNANVIVDIADLDLGSNVLEPFKPLRAHLILNGGVLSLDDIEARTGQGSLGGSLRLDGRGNEALWNADLRLDDLSLQTWIHQKRSREQPPYLTGNLDARARLEGQGKSTAAILGSLKGGIRLNVVDGSISHLGVEAAGLDVAQALGEFIKGDDSLRMNCAVADLIADRGVLRPRVMVVDTTDSVVWVDGSVSLASEALDLRLLVSPRDFSPLALRTPVRLEGTLGSPSVSLEMGKLGGRLGAAALLAFVTPVAAVIPFFDIGSRDDAKRGSASCHALLQRIAKDPRLSAPGVATPISAPATIRREGVSPTTARPRPLPRGAPPPVVRLGPPSTR